MAYVACSESKLSFLLSYTGISLNFTILPLEKTACEYCFESNWKMYTQLNTVYAAGLRI